MPITANFFTCSLCKKKFEGISGHAVYHGLDGAFGPQGQSVVGGIKGRYGPMEA
jgi:hypothetical protein